MDLAGSSHLCFRRNLFAATHGGVANKRFKGTNLALVTLQS